MNGEDIVELRRKKKKKKWLFGIGCCSSMGEEDGGDSMAPEENRTRSGVKRCGCRCWCWCNRKWWTCFSRW